MKVFRIERKKYLESTLTGLGAAKSKGFRWNSFNTSMIYTAESRALALLEVAMHLDLNEDLPKDRYIVEIDIPERIHIQEVRITDLPKNWNVSPPTKTTRYIGDDFVTDNETAVLKVPSSIVPQEFNYLINPNHPDIRYIKVLNQSSLQFDPRFRLYK